MRSARRPEFPPGARRRCRRSVRPLARRPQRCRREVLRAARHQPARAAVDRGRARRVGRDDFRLRSHRDPRRRGWLRPHLGGHAKRRHVAYGSLRGADRTFGIARARMAVGRHAARDRAGRPGQRPDRSRRRRRILRRVDRRTSRRCESLRWSLARRRCIGIRLVTRRQPRLHGHGLPAADIARHELTRGRDRRLGRWARGDAGARLRDADGRHRAGARNGLPGERARGSRRGSTSCGRWRRPVPARWSSSAAAQVAGHRSRPRRRMERAA